MLSVDEWTLNYRYLFADLFAKKLWTGTEDSEDCGNYNMTFIPFFCSHEHMPMPCDSDSDSISNSVQGTSLSSLGYIFSFGEDNNKDVFILASKGVYRIVHPTHCGYTCSFKHHGKTTANVKNASSVSNL